MASRVTERRLVDVLIAHVRRDHAVAREVRHYEKRIDLLVLCPHTKELWAIEAKTANWMRALSQAIVNLSAAERSYIAVYSRHVHRVNLDLLTEHGIGLISVGTGWGEVKFLREADRSPYRNRLMVERLKARIARSA